MSRLEVDLSGRVGCFDVSAAFKTESGITALFGPSGAGKTTILKMIAGIVRPTAGRIVVSERILFDADKGVDLAPPQRLIGFVYQDARLFPHLSVRRNLTYARWAGRRASVRPFDEVAALLGLGGLLDRAPATLSGGERQRVAIGRALLSEPELLLMDEPLSALDQQRREEILPYLEAIRENTKIPILYVSHRTEDVARLADTVVLIEAGRVRQAGPVAEIFGRLDFGGSGEGDEAGALVEGMVSAIDHDFETATVAVDGAEIELTGRGFQSGDRVRLRIRASDVALARETHAGLSIRNQIACAVDEIGPSEGAHVTLALVVSGHEGSQRLLARVTRKSFIELDIVRGEKVVALLKAVSIEPPRVGRHA